MLRILVLEGYADSSAGGAESSMRNFLESISPRHEIFLACTVAGDFVTDPKKCDLYADVATLPLKNIAIGTLTSSLADVFKLVRIVRERNIDRIVTHMVHVSPLLRVVKQITACPFSIYFKWVLSKDSAGAKVAWGNAGIDKAAAVSGFVRRWWIKNGVPADQIEVVPEGIDVGVPALSRGHPIPELGFAGRIVPEKGLIDLLYALPIVREAVPRTILRIAGSFRVDAGGAAYQQEVRAVIARLKLEEAIIFDGFVSPLEGWLADRDLVVVPSTCDDAQPLVMMQSMGVATPVVATEVGGIPEVLSDDFSSLLVPAGAPDRIASTIIALLREPDRRKDIGRGLRERCLARYDRPVHVSSLINALGLASLEYDELTASTATT